MISLVLIITLAPLGADAADVSSELTPEKVAAIRQEQSKAFAAIDRKYGNKKQAELTAEERKAREQERNAASRAVMEKAGTDDKTFSRYEARLNKEERSQMKQEEARLHRVQQSSATAQEPEESVEPELLTGEAADEVLGTTREPPPVKAVGSKKASKKKRGRNK